MNKRWISLLLVVALMCACALAQEERAPIILMCTYQQVGWGQAARALFLDERGDIWQWRGEWETLLSDEENLAFLQGLQDVKQLGHVDGERLFALKSLIACCEAPDMSALRYVANDYGAISYTAVRYGRDGSAELIPLALTGDEVQENLEENAHALYLLMTQLGVAVDADEFPPTPFPKQSLAAFCGYSEDIFEGATLSVTVQGCEEGNMQEELQPEEAQQLLARLSTLEVTGKLGCYSLTESTLYRLLSADGETIAVFEFYADDELATKNGVYTLQ